MQYQNERSTYGKFMFNTILRASKFLMNHIWLYYLLNYTWGIIMTAVGWVVFLFMKIFLSKKIIEQAKFGPCFYTMIGNNWGGLSLGVTFLLGANMGKSWTLHTKQHEMGHTFQNAILGPFAIFLVYIPSFIRYWLFSYNQRRGKPNKEYDAIWFEGNATTVGEIYYEDNK